MIAGRFSGKKAVLIRANEEGTKVTKPNYKINRIRVMVMVSLLVLRDTLVKSQNVWDRRRSVSEHV